MSEESNKTGEGPNKVTERPGEENSLDEGLAALTALTGDLNAVAQTFAARLNAADAALIMRLNAAAAALTEDLNAAAATLTARLSAAAAAPKATPESPIFLILPTTPEARKLYNRIMEPGGPRGDSGTDIRFPSMSIIHGADEEGLPTVVDLQIRVRCMVGREFVPFQIVPRSSISKTPLSLANSIGIIDRGYTGPLKVALRNHGKDSYVVMPGDALFQLVLPGLVPARMALVDEDTDEATSLFGEGATQRGAGGFGSTGSEGQK